MMSSSTEQPAAPQQPAEPPKTDTPTTPAEPAKPAEPTKPATPSESSTPAAPAAPAPAPTDNPATPAQDPGSAGLMTTGTQPTTPTSPTTNNESGETGDSKIKFSIGLEGVSSSAALGSGGGGFGTTGTGTLSGDQLASGWISDTTQKQIAMHVTIFHSFPAKGPDGKYHMVVDSIDATGALAAGQVGQPARWDKGLLSTTSSNCNNGNFKVGASFAIKNHGVDYFSHYYPGIEWTYNKLVKLRNNFLLNAEILVPTGGNQAKAFKVKIVDEGPHHDQKGTGLWILDVMSAYAMLDENQGTFVASTSSIPDLKNSEYKFPFANVSYDVIKGEIAGYSPAAEIEWIDKQETSAEQVNIIGNKINGLMGTCRIKFFIDPSHKADAESIMGCTLPDELFTCNATYTTGGSGNATIDAGSGIGAFSTAGVSQELLDKYINKPIQFSPQNYPPLQRVSLSQVQSNSSIFGNHGSSITTIAVPANYPLKVYTASGKRVTKIQCHKLVAERLKCALTDIINHYGPEIESVAPGACIFHGSFVDRKITGGSSWSSHAYGIALDFDADNNGLKTHAPSARLSQAIYKPFWEIWYYHGFYSQGIETDIKKTRRGTASDWMHIQAAHYGTA